jgi:hypothetical protein
MSDYNLLEEEWIPVLYQNGEYARLGIKKTLEDAHIIRQIATSNPMDRVALIRFLLAILYWCKGNPAENDQLPEKFPMEWFKKLEENRDCFNLLGEGKRFYQDKDVKNNTMLPVSSIIHEIPTGTSINHFRHSVDGIDGLCPACCAIGLLRLPVFTTQGGQGKGPGINNKPPLYIIPIGQTLLETLNFSYKPVEDLGSPAWENNNSTDDRVPLLNGFTDLPRLVWFKKPLETGICMNCGRNEHLVQECIFSGNNNRKKDVYWKDPHVAYIDNKSLGTDNPIKIWFKTDRPWTNLLNYFLNTNQNLPQNFLVVGFASDQAKHIDIWERTLTISNIAQNESQAVFLKKWDEAVKKIPSLIRDFRRKTNLNERSIVRGIRPHIENEISSNLIPIIDGKIQPWEFACTEYNKLMPSVASSLSPGFTCIQMKKRNAISETIPTLELKKDKKSKKIKERN